MSEHNVVSREEWLAARRAHLAKEKEFTRLRDELSQERRELPWVRVEKEYLFEGPAGTQSLADLFDGKSQLIVYHFMFGVDWEDGCLSCSFWADNYNGTEIHLANRDISLVAVSRAPLTVLEKYKQRMGWVFDWVSAQGDAFNEDYQVSPSAEDLAKEETMYNYRLGKPWGDEAPGISVFYKNEAGEIFHTYSCYSRGLDIVNGAYHMMDLTPKGRDEKNLPWSMAWLRRHDEYQAEAV